jgi:hypothetical protein
MAQDTNAGKPAAKEEAQSSSGPRPAPAPGVIYPRCPHCQADPMTIFRLRYDFPDNVIAEILFCGNPACRAVAGAQIVGYPIPRASVPEPPRG